MDLLPSIDLAWLRRFTKCNRLAAPKLLAKINDKMKPDSSPRFPPPFPITETEVIRMFTTYEDLHMDIIGNLHKIPILIRRKRLVPHINCLLKCVAFIVMREYSFSKMDNC